MESNQNQPPENTPPRAAEFGSVWNDAESFRTVPKPSEPFGSVPHAAERKESHSLTVRDAARLFEVAGVARTERSITNWCQLNRTGVARLDAYFDPNERKYYISPQSVETAIAEERAKATKMNDQAEAFGKTPQGSESFRTIPHLAETAKNNGPLSEGDKSRLLELERENLDLRITNRAKDMMIEQVQKEREKFFDRLLTANRKVGELENRLLQLESRPAKSD